MNLVATVEARMTSSRLPGKVLLPAGGQPMLQHLINRLKRVTGLHGIVLATTVNQADDPLVALAQANGISSYRGSETDVMARVIGAAEAAGAEAVVEITGDCPVIDPVIIEQAIRMFFGRACDYVSNVRVRSYPDGMDTQVFRLAALKRSAGMTADAIDHEHVTLHLRSHPELFSQADLVAPPELSWPQLRLTLDEWPDYELLKNVIEYFTTTNTPSFGCGDVIRLLRSRPDWVALNHQVLSKGEA